MSTQLKKKSLPSLARKTFTLLELFICIAILSIAAGALGWHLKGLYAHHQLDSSARSILCTLKEAQALALSYRTDFEVELVKKGKGLELKMTTEEPIKGFSTFKTELGGGCSVTFKDKPISVQKFAVFSTGRIQPEGILAISKNGKTLWIDLQTPIQINLSQKEPEKLKKSGLPPRP